MRSPMKHIPIRVQNDKWGCVWRCQALQPYPLTRRQQWYRKNGEELSLSKIGDQEDWYPVAKITAFAGTVCPSLRSRDFPSFAYPMARIGAARLICPAVTSAWKLSGRTSPSSLTRTPQKFECVRRRGDSFGILYASNWRTIS